MDSDSTALDASPPRVPSNESPPGVPSNESLPRFFNFSAWQQDNPPAKLESPWYPPYVAGLEAVNERMFEVALDRFSQVCHRIHEYRQWQPAIDLLIRSPQ